MLEKDQIFRARKDEEYRDSLSSEERAVLPERPEGGAMSDADLESAAGGIAPIIVAAGITAGGSVATAIADDVGDALKD